MRGRLDLPAPRTPPRGLLDFSDDEMIASLSRRTCEMRCGGPKRRAYASQSPGLPAISPDADLETEDGV
jgi:hypothetical protein